MSKIYEVEVIKALNYNGKTYNVRDLLTSADIPDRTLVGLMQNEFLIVRNEAGAGDRELTQEVMSSLNEQVKAEQQRRAEAIQMEAAQRREAQSNSTLDAETIAKAKQAGELSKNNEKLRQEINSFKGLLGDIPNPDKEPGKVKGWVEKIAQKFNGGDKEG